MKSLQEIAELIKRLTFLTIKFFFSHFLNNINNVIWRIFWKQICKNIPSRLWDILSYKAIFQFLR